MYEKLCCEDTAIQRLVKTINTTYYWVSSFNFQIFRKELKSIIEKTKEKTNTKVISNQRDEPADMLNGTNCLIVKIDPA